MKERTFSMILAAAAAGSILLSCTANGGSIYATIQTEQKVIDNSLPNTLTVTNIVVTPPVAAGSNYYVAAGGVFHGVLGATSVTWTPNQTDPTSLNPANALCNALAFFQGELWGGFFATGENIGLVKSTSLSFAGQPEQIAATAGGTKQVTMLRKANNNLLMASATVTQAPVYALEYTSDGTMWNTVTLPANTTPVLGVAWDGTSYWAVTASTIYKSATVSGAFAAPSSAPALAAAGDSYHDVYADPSSGRVFVSTKKSGISYSTDGGNAWTAVAAALVSNATVGFLAVAGPADVSGSGAVYLAGSDGYGYYTLSASANTLTRMADTTIALYSESVSTIAVDGTNVFMGTHGHGVWRATFDTATGTLAAASAWTHE